MNKPGNGDPGGTAWCEGTLVESEPGRGECSAGERCTALQYRDDYATYRAAHERVVDRAQNANRTEYGGEA